MVCFNNEEKFKFCRSLRNWGRRSANYGEKETFKRRLNCEIDGIRYDDKYVFDDRTSILRGVHNDNIFKIGLKIRISIEGTDIINGKISLGFASV